MNTEKLKEVLAQARHETGKVIIGQNDVIERALIAIITGMRHPGFQSVEPVGRRRIVGFFAVLALVVVALPFRARVGW